MKLSVKSLAMSVGVMWGGCLLLFGLATTLRGVQPDGGYYAKDFLLAMASVYPGYSGGPGMASAAVGAVYGLIDGAICGAVIAWLYNRCSCSDGDSS